MIVWARQGATAVSGCTSAYTDSRPTAENSSIRFVFWLTAALVMLNGVLIPTLLGFDRTAIGSLRPGSRWANCS